MRVIPVLASVLALAACSDPRADSCEALSLTERMPTDQQQFLTLISKVAAQAEGSGNVLVNDGLISSRRDQVSAFLRGLDRKDVDIPADVSGWIGTVERIGKAVPAGYMPEKKATLVVRVGPNVVLRTRGDLGAILPFSEDTTQIPEKSPQYAMLLGCSEGQEVKFAGYFTGCGQSGIDRALATNCDWDLAKSLRSPEFLFRFVLIDCYDGKDPVAIKKRCETDGKRM